MSCCGWYEWSGVLILTMKMKVTVKLECTVGLYWPQELTLVKKVVDLKLTSAISGMDRMRGTNKSCVQTLAKVLFSLLTVVLSLSVHTTETKAAVWTNMQVHDQTNRCCVTRQVLCDQQTGVVQPTDKGCMTNRQRLCDQQTGVVRPTDRVLCDQTGVQWDDTHRQIVTVCTHHWNQQTGVV